MYVRVVDNARPQPGKPVFRVSVEVAPADVRSVQSSDLLSFRAGNSLPRDRGNRGSFGRADPQALSAASASSSVGHASSSLGQQEGVPEAARVQQAPPAEVGILSMSCIYNSNVHAPRTWERCWW